MINDPAQEKEIEIKQKLKTIGEYVDKGLVGSKQIDVIVRRLEEVIGLVKEFDEWEEIPRAEPLVIDALFGGTDWIESEK